MTYQEMLRAGLDAEADGDQNVFYACFPKENKLTVVSKFCHCSRLATGSDNPPQTGWRHVPGCSCVICVPRPKTTVTSMSAWLADHGRTR